MLLQPVNRSIQGIEQQTSQYEGNQYGLRELQQQDHRGQRHQRERDMANVQRRRHERRSGLGPALCGAFFGEVELFTH